MKVELFEKIISNLCTLHQHQDQDESYGGDQEVEQGDILKLSLTPTVSLSLMCKTHK